VATRLDWRRWRSASRFGAYIKILRANRFITAFHGAAEWRILEVKTYSAGGIILMAYVFLHVYPRHLFRAADDDADYKF